MQLQLPHNSANLHTSMLLRAHGGLCIIFFKSRFVPLFSCIPNIDFLDKSVQNQLLPKPRRAVIFRGISEYVPLLTGFYLTLSAHT